MKPIIIALAVLIVAGGITAAVYVSCVKVPQGAADSALAVSERAGQDLNAATNNALTICERIANDCDKVIHFRPRITVAGRTVINNTTAIKEYAAVERTFSSEYDWTHNFFGSVKEIRLGGDFIAKAGYDLSKPFSLNISKDGKSISATIPAAEILSVEEVREKVVVDADGIINKLSPRDREDAKNQLLMRAKEDIAGSDICKEADRDFRNQLLDLLRKDSPEPVTIIQSSPVHR